MSNYINETQVVKHSFSDELKNKRIYIEVDNCSVAWLDTGWCEVLDVDDEILSIEMFEDIFDLTIGLFTGENPCIKIIEIKEECVE